MKTLAVIVTSPPNNPLTQTALQFIEQAANDNIQLLGVFFYQSGVLNASQYLTIPSDEFPLKDKWTSLSKDKGVSLFLCSTAAEKHGLIDESQPNNLSLINPCFTLAGLGELVELTNKADKTVQL